MARLVNTAGVEFTGALLIGGTPGEVATVQADGSVGPAALPGVTAQQFLTEAPPGAVTVADNASAPLVWAQNGGATLLNLAAPATPTIIDHGTYAINATVTVSALTAAGSAFYTFDAAAGVYVAVGAAYAARAFPVSLLVVGVFAAGDPLVLTVANHDGAASRDFALSGAVVQRLS